MIKRLHSIFDRYARLVLFQPLTECGSLFTHHLHALLDLSLRLELITASEELEHVGYFMGLREFELLVSSVIYCVVDYFNLQFFRKSLSNLSPCEMFTNDILVSVN